MINDKPKRRRLPLLTLTQLGAIGPAIILIACIVAWLLAKQSHRTESRAESPRDAVLNAKTSLEAGRAYQEMLEGADELQLAQLQEDPNIGIALTAAYEPIVQHAQRWQQLRSESVSLAAGEYERHKASHRDLALDFVEFLEQRTGLDAPRWWKENLYTYWPQALPDDTANPDGKMSVDDGVLTLPDGRQISITRDALRALEHPDYLLDYYSNASILINGRTYLLPYTSVGDAAPLLCLDSDSGALIWQADGWALGFDNLTRVASYLHVTMLTTIELDEQVLVVWGAGNPGNYLEAYDTETGKSLYRFSTRLWCAR